jgi:hypothetical protein
MVQNLTDGTRKSIKKFLLMAGRKFKMGKLGSKSKEEI